MGSKKLGFNSQFKLIKQGAEARIYKGMYLNRRSIVKERFKKSYRHTDLDDHITKERIRAEVKSIIRCKAAGVHTPALYLVDFARKSLFMEEVVNAVTVKEYLEELAHCEASSKDIEFVTHEIGVAIGKIHANRLIHGDLTTSNILIVNKQDQENRHLVFIDFGLSAADPLPEDKAVDLYVLERAITSTHANAELFPAILAAYKASNPKGAVDILKKLEEVRARGRKRTMVG